HRARAWVGVDRAIQSCISSAIRYDANGLPAAAGVQRGIKPITLVESCKVRPVSEIGHARPATGETAKPGPPDRRPVDSMSSPGGWRGFATKEFGPGAKGEHMRVSGTHLTVFAILTSLSSSADAADLPPPVAPVAPGAVATWNRFYVSLHGGVG